MYGRAGVGNIIEIIWAGEATLKSPVNAKKTVSPTIRAAGGLMNGRTNKWTDQQTGRPTDGLTAQQSGLLSSVQTT